MVFYLILLLVVLFFISIGYLYKPVRFICYIYVSLLLLFISMFRYKTGFDYTNYLESIDIIIKGGTNSYNLFFERMDPGYKLIILTSYYFKSRYLFFFVSSFFTIILISVSIYKLSVDYLLSIFIFFCFPFFYFDSFSIIRQWLSIAIIVYSYVLFFGNGNLMLFVFNVIIASLFHYTSVVALLIIPFFYINLSKKKIVYVFLFFVVIKYFLYKILFLYGVNFLGKLDRVVLNRGGEKLEIFIIMLSIGFFVFKKKIDLFSKELSVHVNVFFVGALLFYLLGDLGQIAQRVSVYFYFTIIFIFPHFNKLFCANKSFKIPFKFLLYSCFTYIYVYSLFISYSRINFSPIIPYKFIFFA